MNKVSLGRLITVEHREYWKTKHETSPHGWPGKKILLCSSESLGIEIEVQSTDEFVGPFRADIL